MFLLVIVGSNVVSNVVLSRYERRFGRRSFLLLFSGLMAAAGLLLFLTTSTPMMLLAFFIGNISTTGTEAGPFQSIETGVLPSLVAPERTNRLFGAYNVVGYGAASVGALAASIPGYFQNSLQVFRLLYLFYGLVGLLLLLLYTGLRDIEAPTSMVAKGTAVSSPKVKKDITRLSALFSLDAFGGGFVSQSLLTYWFFLVYRVSITDLGIIFFVVNIIAAISIFAASLIAERFGNLRTMVTTHLLSSVFLTIIPFAGSLVLSLLFLFLRQSISQMDVPTRQAFMVELFKDEDRVRANATTNTFRSIGSLFGGPISGVMYSVGLIALPIVTAGVSKIAYDIAIYSSYRREVK
jgi:MFS family permease